MFLVELVAGLLVAAAAAAGCLAVVSDPPLPAETDWYCLW